VLQDLRRHAFTRFEAPQFRDWRQWAVCDQFAGKPCSVRRLWPWCESPVRVAGQRPLWGGDTAQ